MTCCPIGGRPVWGDGDPTSADVWIIGEGPGEEEDRTGIPFCGKSGKEQDNYLSRAHLSRDDCYITNLVKCRPPGNRDPKPGEIEACQGYLESELMMMKPGTVIAPMGRFAIRWFLGQSTDTEIVHGLPQPWFNQYTNTHHLVVPCYHPAAGLHNTRYMTQVRMDYEALGKTVRGEMGIPVDQYPKPHYASWRTMQHWDNVVGVDTESDGNKPWSAQISCKPGTGYMVKADNGEGMFWLKNKLEHPDTLTILHFAQHDLPVLSKMGIVPARWTDTLLMANLLQDVPRGLKALGYRLCGTKMQDYRDMVDPYTRIKCIKYLEEVIKYDWPMPEPIMTRTKGIWKTVQPTGVNRRVKGILNDLEKGKDIDPYERWLKIDDPNVVKELGPLTPATIKDVTFGDAMAYACRDADITRRVYHILWKRICQENLQSVLDRDIRQVPMVVDIQNGGMPVDLDHFRDLGIELVDRYEKVESKIVRQIGYWINPGSPEDCRNLLFTKLGLKPIKKTKGKTNFSSDNSVLERLRGTHPVVDDIIEWRSLETLKTSFVDVLITKAASDGNVRSSWGMSTVVTGRLNCRNPNLMAIPIRTTDGRRIREGFIAPPGCVILDADYSQAEMRIIAHESQDPVMIDIFNKDEDIHTMTACIIFGLSPSQVDEMKHRYPTKRAGFGILNYISASGLQRELEVGGAHGWTESQCQDLIDRWFSTYGAVKAKMEEWKATARRYGKVWDGWGRYRLVPETISAHPYIREAGLRQAANFPIQSGAQQFIKEAMGDLIPVYGYFQEQGHTLRPMAQIHDSITFLMDESLLDVAAPIIKSVMENAFNLSVPMRVDFKVGKNWGQMSKYS
jgi:uracil-DNA glycosylase family 4